MLPYSAILFLAWSLLAGLAAAVRLGPGPKTATEADGVGCSSERYEKVGDDCYDSSGELAAEECCRFSKTCREEVSALSQDCAVHLQHYMQGCELLHDVQADDSELKIINNTRLCSEQCQNLPEFSFDATLRNLEELQDKCPFEIGSISVIIRAVQQFDFEWRACPPVTERLHIAGVRKVGNMAKDLLNQAQIMPRPLMPKKIRKPRWGPVQITTHWVPPVFNLQTAFETLWTAIPVTYSEEFRIRGTVGAIQEELLLRPDLPISCPADHIGQPVHLVVAKVQKKAAQAYLRAWAGAFANLAGVSTFALAAPVAFDVGGEGIELASALAANPTQVTLDKAVDYMMDHMHRTPRRSLRKLWRWLGNTKNEAFLTLADPNRKGHVGAKVMFQCNMMTVNGKEKAVATWVDGTATHTIVTAKHLAFLITSLA